MTIDDVRNSVIEDAKDYINDEMDEYVNNASKYDDTEDIFEDIFQDMFVGSVTGNDNGTYSYSRSLSRALMVDMLNAPEFIDMIKEFDIDVAEHLADGDWEGLEVCLRCYLLSEAYSDLYDYCVQNYFVQKLED